MQGNEPGAAAEASGRDIGILAALTLAAALVSCALCGGLAGVVGTLPRLLLSAALLAALLWPVNLAGSWLLRRRAAQLAGVEVEILQVECERAVALEGEHSSVDPALLVEIGGGKLLFLCGQWAWDPATYGAGDDASSSEDTQAWNRLFPPHEFPARRFTLTRLPLTGQVLGIRIEGPTLLPERSLQVELAARRPRRSDVVTGSLGDVEGALAALPREAS